MYRRGTLVKELLKAIGEMTGLFSWPPEYSEGWRLEQLYGSRKKIYDTLWQLEKRGWVKAAEENGKKFFKLTSQGQMEILVKKAIVGRAIGAWDGKWRMVVFDIPESARDKRNHLRFLLKQNNFYRLQASVFISPYALNRDAIKYLKLSGLIGYIRFIRVGELDDDKDLRKKFNLR